jgi:hypothetical protein
MSVILGYDATSMGIILPTFWRQHSRLIFKDKMSFLPSRKLRSLETSGIPSAVIRVPEELISFLTNSSDCQK